MISTAGWKGALRTGLCVMGMVLPASSARSAEDAATPSDTLPGASSDEGGPAEAAPDLYMTVPELAERVQQTEDLVLNRQPRVIWEGYIDFGFYVPQGDGSGYVQDVGHVQFPEYDGRFGWVFLGDIMAQAINTRGEPADLGSAPGVDRFDSINSRGAPGFVLNETNVRLRAAITPTAIASASLNVTPRTGDNFRLGDMLDLDIAQVEWLPTESGRTSIFAGKIESVIGIEYRDRKSYQRFGVTPSLISRYTINPALGVKVRSKFGEDDWFVVAAAVTNGSNTAEQFHFYNEIDSNAGKTLSGRLSVRLPVPGSVELGFSGSHGAQDRALNSDGAMWFAGPDLLAQLGPVDVKIQWLAGRSPGRAIDDVYALRLNGGGYVEVDWRITPTFGVMGRGEYRDARVWLGDERLYLTKSWRATLGARMTLGPGSALKAEYLHNGEFGGLPAVKNDVFTSSLVLSF